MRRAAPLSRITSPRAPVTTTASAMLRKIASNSSRCSASESTSATIASAASSRGCSARPIASAPLGSRCGGGRRFCSAAATASSLSARRDSVRPSELAGIAARSSPTTITRTTQTGDAAPVAASTTRNMAAGARPIPIATISPAVGDLSKRFGVETITDASHREDQFGIGVVALDMLAQAADVNVDGPRFDERVASPHHVEQLFARIHTHRMLHEKFQQLELAQRKLPAPGVDKHLVSAEVHPQAPFLIRAAAGVRL